MKRLLLSLIIIIFCLPRLTNARNHNTQYTYDFENRLTKIVYPDGTTSEYEYNGVGKRVESIENGVITKYLYDGLNAIIERDVSDTTIATYIRGLSYGGGIGSIISVLRNQSIRYYHYDGLGTVTGLSDPQGSLVQAYQYDAYGNLLATTGQIVNPYQFSTKEYSSKSGLIYFGARYYGPQIGRFITKDPVGLVGGGNKYSYCGNNPVIFIDHWGLRRATAEVLQLGVYSPYDILVRGGKQEGGSAAAIFGGLGIDPEGTIQHLSPQLGLLTGEFHQRTYTEPTKVTGVGVGHKEQVTLVAGEAVLGVKNVSVEAGGKVYLVKGEAEATYIFGRIIGIRIKLGGTLGSAGAELSIGKKLKVGAHWGVGGSITIEFIDPMP